MPPPPWTPQSLTVPADSGPLVEVAFAFGKLSQTLDSHPLLPAIRYRARLEAARRAAAADGIMIDPWHLAVVLAGLRPLQESDRIADRGGIFDAAREALMVYGWLADPDFDQEGQIQEAERSLQKNTAADPFRVAAMALRAWVEAGKPRMAIRAAMERHWYRYNLMPSCVPLIAASSLSADEAWQADLWIPAFYRSLAVEAKEIIEMTWTLERDWRQARQAVTIKRRTSHAPALIDLLAATPCLSAPVIASLLGIAPKNAMRLLDELVGAGAIIELTGRDKRRLYALPHLSPLRESAAAPRRPDPGRGRGRPRGIEPQEQADSAFVVVGVPKREPFKFDYSELEAAAQEAERITRKTAIFLKDFIDKS